MKPLYVSYHTAGNGYEAESDALRRTLDAFRLPYEILAVPPFSCWHEATQYKALFLRDVLGRHDRPVVWLDADARVKQYPALFDALACDFAAVWKDDTELLSSTLYLGPTPGARRLVEAWVGANRANPDGINGDQMNLQQVVEKADWLGQTRLPPPYALIFDLMARQGPPVIEQTQASRRLRK